VRLMTRFSFSTSHPSFFPFHHQVFRRCCLLSPREVPLFCERDRQLLQSCIAVPDSDWWRPPLQYFCLKVLLLPFAAGARQVPYPGGSANPPPVKTEERVALIQATLLSLSFLPWPLPLAFSEREPCLPFFDECRPSTATTFESVIAPFGRQHVSFVPGARDQPEAIPFQTLQRFMCERICSPSLIPSGFPLFSSRSTRHRRASSTSTPNCWRESTPSPPDHSLPMISPSRLPRKTGANFLPLADNFPSFPSSKAATPPLDRIGYPPFPPLK